MLYEESKYSIDLSKLDMKKSNSPRLLNISMGYYTDYFEPHPLLDKYMKKATEAGIIICTSAGNHTTNNDIHAHWPSDYCAGKCQVLGIASHRQVENRRELDFFSNYGKEKISGSTKGRFPFREDGADILKIGTSYSTALITARTAYYLSFGNDFNRIRYWLNHDPASDFIQV